MVTAARKVALVAPRKEKAEKQETSRRKRELTHFLDHHPLARMYRAICYIDYAREARHWYHLGFWANEVCSAYANLDEQLQAWLDEYLPGEIPDAVGERSGYAWIAYITTLSATRTRWERFRTAVADRIVGSWGADFLPTVLRPVSDWDYTEPPF